MPEYCTYIIDKSTSTIFQSQIFDFIKYDLQRKIVAEAKAEIQVKSNETVKNRTLNVKKLLVFKFLFTSIKTDDEKGMTWKPCPDGDELNDNLYLNHLSYIEILFKEAEAIEEFNLQKATNKAFTALRMGSEVMNIERLDSRPTGSDKAQTYKC